MPQITRSVRFRLMLLTILVVIPIYGIMFYTTTQQHRSRIISIANNAERLAGLVASEEEQLMSTTYELLKTLAAVPAVQSGDTTTCGTFLASLLGDNPHYVNFGEFDPNGNVICSALPLSNPIDVVSYPWFQHAVQSGEFTIGEYQVSPLTGKEVLRFNYPIKDENGQVTRVIFAAMDLSWLSQHEVEIMQQLPLGTTLAKIDRNGIILSHQPYPEKWVGNPAPQGLADEVFSQKRGTIELSDADGVARIYAFAPVHSILHSGDIYVILGVPETELFEDTDQLLSQNLIVLGSMTLLSLAGVWILGDLFFMRQARSILSAAKRLAAGDFSARTGLPEIGGEIGQIAQTFDGMAEALEQREMEREQAAQRLIESEKRFRGIFESGPECVKVLSADGVIQQMNSAGMAMLEVDITSDVIGHSIFQFIPSEYHQAYQALLKSVLQGGAGSLEHEIIGIKGSHRWLETHAVCLQNGNRHGNKFLAVTRDITEIKRSQQILRENEERFRSLVQHAYDIITIHDKEGTILYATPSLTRVLGYDVQDLIGRNAFELIHPDDLNLVVEGFREVVNALNPGIPTEYRVCRADGSIVHLESIGRNLLDQAGINGIVLNSRDITKRRQAGEEIRRLNQFLEHVIDSANLWVDVLDENTNVLIWNKAAEAISGYTREEVVGHGKIWEWLYPDAKYRQEITDRALAIITKNETVYDFETIIKNKSGEERIISWYSKNLTDEKGTLIGSVALGLDVTERKQHERELHVVAALSAALRTANSRVEMLPIILDQVLDLFKADSALLAMRDPATNEGVIELMRGDSLMLEAGTRISPGEGIVGHVIQTGEIYLANGAKSGPHLTERYVNDAILTAACVPLLVEGKVIGALGVYRNSKLSGDEVSILTAVVNIATIAIHRATLHEQTEQRLQRLVSLCAIDAAITSSADLNHILNVLIDQVVSQLRVDAASVLLITPHTQTLDFKVGRGFRTKAIEHSRLYLGDGKAGLAALEKRIEHIASLNEEEENFLHGSQLAGEGFVTYYGVPLIAKGLVKGVLEIFHRSPLDSTTEWLNFMEVLANQAAIAIDNALLFNGMQRSNIELSLAYESTLAGWSAALDLRDRETEGHSQRVTELTLQLARTLGMSEDELVHVRRGALLHDIGKMGVPDKILLKPGPLTQEEWEIMCKHPVVAYELLSPIDYLRPALDIPYCHHEKWDGSGYPRGLKGEQIPLAARIFAFADVWDALTSDRPYRPAWTKRKATAYIHQQAGIHFDPKVLSVFLKLIGRK